MFIDADTHVDECEETFSYIPKALEHLRPHTISFNPEDRPSWLGSDRDSGSGLSRFWFIDGNLYPRRIRSDQRTRTVIATRELHDVGARLRHMDALEVELQVIYPTLFLREVSLRADISVALNRSYNRWLADRCSESKGRLQWIALIPYHDMTEALAEIRWAKEHGAVGILKRGVEMGGLVASDPYFRPIYELCADLEMAVCVHQGSGFVPMVSFLRNIPGGDAETFPVISAFSYLLNSSVLQNLSSLHIGFIEAGAAWLPHLLGQAGWNWSRSPEQRERIFSDLNFFITTEIYEDVPYLLNVLGSDNRLLVGSDYTHGDRSSVLDVHKEMVARTDLEAASVRGITEQNARDFYRL